MAAKHSTENKRYPEQSGNRLLQNAFKQQLDKWDKQVALKTEVVGLTMSFVIS